MKAFLSAIIFCFITFFAAAQTSLTPQWLVNPAVSPNGGNLYIQHIAATKDGYIYATGFFYNTADFDPGPGTFNITAQYGANTFVVKYDKDGKLVFAFSLPSSKDFNLPGSITTDENDNIYLAGVFAYDTDFDPGPATFNIHFANHNSGNMFIAKYDSNGNFIFAKGIGGSNRNNVINAVSIDHSHNIYISGRYEGSHTDFDPGPGIANLPGDEHGNIFIAKYDAAGNYLFAEAIQGGVYDIANAMVIDKQNNIVIAGHFQSGANDFDPSDKIAQIKQYGNGDFFIAKYDSAGRYMNAQSFGGPEYEDCNAIACDNDNNIIVVGRFSSAHIDFDGSADSLIKSTNGGYDFFIAKYTPGGALRFVQTLGGIYNDNATGITTDGENNIYVTGTFAGTVSFGSKDSLVAAAGNNDFFAKYDKSGNCMYARQINTTSTNLSSADIVVNGKGEIVIAGSFNGTADFNSCTAVYNLTSEPINGFIAAYDKNDGSFTFAGQIGGYRSFNLYTSVTAAAQDNEGNIYVTGFFEGQVDFDPGPDTLYLTSQTDASSNSTWYFPHDVYFAKYNQNGKLIFAKDLGGADGAINTSAMVIDEDQNIYLSGDFYHDVDFDPSTDTAILSTRDPRYQQFFFAKYNTAGEYLFAKKIWMDDAYGGSIKSIAADKNKNIYIAGEFHHASFNTADTTDVTKAIGQLDIYFARYDAQGNFIYVKNIGKKSHNYQECNSLKLTDKNSLIISGAISDNNIDFDPGPATHFANIGAGAAHYIASYTLDGNFLFEVNAKVFSGQSVINQMVLDRDNILVSGNFAGKIDFDPSADTALFIGSNFYFSPFFAEYSATTGKYIFGKNFYSASSVYPQSINDITVDSTHTIYLTGAAANHADFDPEPDTAFLPDPIPGVNSGNAYIAKYDDSGYYMAAYQIGTNIGANRILVNNNQEITLAGTLKGYEDFAPGPDTFYVRPSYPNTSSLYVVNYQQQACPSPYNLLEKNITAAAANLNWNYPFNPQGFQLIYKPAAAAAWSAIKLNGTERSHTIGNLLPATNYKWMVRAQCGGDTSLFSITKNFTTLAANSAKYTLNNTSELMDEKSIAAFSISPNPVTNNYFQISLRLKENAGTKIKVQLYNAVGQTVYSKTFNIAGSNNIFPVTLPASVLPGSYLVIIHAGNQQYKKTIIKL